MLTENDAQYIHHLLKSLDEAYIVALQSPPSTEVAEDRMELRKRRVRVSASDEEQKAIAEAFISV
jgi:hypothetical protein